MFAFPFKEVSLADGHQLEKSESSLLLFPSLLVADVVFYRSLAGFRPALRFEPSSRPHYCSLKSWLLSSNSSSSSSSSSTVVIVVVAVVVVAVVVVVVAAVNNIYTYAKRLIPIYETDSTNIHQRE